MRELRILDTTVHLMDETRANIAGAWFVSHTNSTNRVSRAQGEESRPWTEIEALDSNRVQA